MENLIQKNRNTANKLSNIVNLLLFGLSLSIASQFNTWNESLIFGSLLFIIPFVFTKISPYSRTTAMTFAISFMGFSALIIHQMEGMIEMHFSIFVLLAFLTVFKDWTVNVVGAVAIAAHHLSFFYLQSSGTPIFVFPAEHMMFTMVLVHAGYVITETAVLVFMSLNAKKDESISNHLINQISAITNNENTLNLKSIEANKNILKEPVIVNFNTMLEKINQIVYQTKSLSTLVHDEINKLNDLKTNLNQSFQKKADEISLVASSTEEMTATIKEISDNANHINESSSKAKISTVESQERIHENNNSVETLGNTLQKTNTKITELSSACHDITKLLRVVSDISDQTNLLALNAAIEAARAGEAGRGFAVVADEVRNLATRTQKSTEEIRSFVDRLLSDSGESVTMMNESLEQIEQSFSLSKDSLKSMSNVANIIDSVNSEANKVAMATEEQNVASLEIARNSANVKELIDSEQELLNETNTIINNLETSFMSLDEMLSKIEAKS